MADSANEVSKPQVEKPSEALVIIKNKDGSVREAIRTAGGTFAKKPRPLIPTVEFVRARRKRLAKVNAKGITEDLSIIEELLEIVHAPLMDKKGNVDGKLAMAKVKASETIWLYTGGKPDPSERELDKLERQPVTAIFVQAPAIMNPEVVDGDKVSDKPTQPVFAEVTGVTTNPKE
jgi:hypothetical protein